MLNRLAAMVACVGFVAVSAPAGATTTRLDSMGGGVKYITVEDEANIFEFPSLLVRYGDMTYVDNMNGPAFFNTRFGFHFALSEDVVLAIYGGRITSLTRPGQPGWDVAGNTFTGSSSYGVGLQASSVAGAGGSASVTTNEFTAYGDPTSAPSDARNGSVDFKIGLMSAFNLGDAFRLGIMLNFAADYGSNIQPENGGQHEKGAFLMDAAIGFGIDLVDAELELTLGLEFGVLEDYLDVGDIQATPGIVDPADRLQQWSASQFGVRIAARFRYDFDERYKLVAYGKFNYGTQEVVFNDVAPGTVAPFGSYGGPELWLGADLRMELFPNVWVVPGLGIRYAQYTKENEVAIPEDSQQLLSLPYYGVGVDVKIFDWLDFRFGAWQSIDMIRLSATAGGVTTEQNSQDVRTNLGTGVGINIPVEDSMLTLDINVNPLFWVNGPDFISGSANNTAGWGLSGAIKYDW